MSSGLLWVRLVQLVVRLCRRFAKGCRPAVEVGTTIELVGNFSDCGGFIACRDFWSLWKEVGKNG